MSRQNMQFSYSCLQIKKAPVFGAGKRNNEKCFNDV